jgi:hypothetical protein
MGRAPTYVAPSPRTGRPQQRCEACKKVVYPSRKHAQAAARSRRRHLKLRAYLGTCKHWHLTSDT